MRAIMVMYDSLNRHLLQPYGCDWTITPNFCRLAERSVQFNQCYVGSMPCMPARRELHTGRANFLHRSWGPMEPYDDSVPQILKENGIYTHLTSDHQHYWEDGGCTYHTRYSSWEISRGQEGDPWQSNIKCKYDRPSVFNERNKLNQYPAFKNWMSADERNREYMDTEEKTPQAVTFEQGLHFIHQNQDVDNWFLQIETFDPHEPFYTLKADRDKYPMASADLYGDAQDDWPPYAKVSEDTQTVEHVRAVYASLVTKCDAYLGKVLDLMDKYDMWKDTMLIVNTDHGFLLGEHGWWGKTAMPIYDEIGHTPLFIYDPRMPELAGVQREAIVQTVDLPATLLEFFGLPLTKDMEGRPLRQVMIDDTPIRKYAVFGYFGSQIDVTDGRYTYMFSAPNPNAPVYEYTLMPTHMRWMFKVDELQDIELVEPFSFTKGCRVMKIQAKNSMGDTTAFGSALYDLASDPTENTAIRDEEVEARMRGYIKEFMDVNDAPKELYERFGFC